ncbi:SCO6880 family protein [Streptomyces luteireticuli]|uniref:Integral membrane protein n=1 Tax=Streptomyces luteireticuli TaxID=173858 RepID=A0ABP3J2K2_9ACTN
MEPDPLTRQPTYGNWRRPQSSGLPGLRLGTTILFLCGLLVVVLLTLVNIWLAIGFGVLLVLGMIPVVVRDRHDRTWAQDLVARAAFRRARSTGSSLYRSGPLGRTGYGTCQLPGLAAGSTLIEAQDAYGRPFALITYRSTNHHVVVLSTDASGAALVDQGQVDTWVAYWGHWLAQLATEPGLVGVSVTVEAAPDTGIRLRHEVEANLAPDAPALAAQVLAEVVDSYPAGSAQISTRIALTYSGAARDGRPRRTAEEMAVELGNRLPGLTADLAITGAGPARPMTGEQLAEAVRVAYDPTAAVIVERARANGEGTGLTWDDAGPMEADAHPTSYWHDGAYSVTWSMSAAPRGEVFSNILTNFLLPHRDIARKRITLLYRPHDVATAANIVQKDVKDAVFQAQQGAQGSARDDVALKAAEQTAREEATGAGVVRFGLLATATVTDKASLPLAEAAMDNLSASARIRLRRVKASQASAFAAALPIGLVLPAHVAMPEVVRDAL